MVGADCLCTIGRGYDCTGLLEVNTMTGTGEQNSFRRLDASKITTDYAAGVRDTLLRLHMVVQRAGRDDLAVVGVRREIRKILAEINR